MQSSTIDLIASSVAFIGFVGCLVLSILWTASKRNKQSDTKETCVAPNRNAKKGGKCYAWIDASCHVGSCADLNCNSCVTDDRGPIGLLFLAVALLAVSVFFAIRRIRAGFGVAATGLESVPRAEPLPVTPTSTDLSPQPSLAHRMPVSASPSASGIAAASA